MTLVTHKWGDFDLVAGNVVWFRGSFGAFVFHTYLFVYALTACVSVIKQSVKVHGPLVMIRSFFVCIILLI